MPADVCRPFLDAHAPVEPLPFAGVGFVPLLNVTCPECWEPCEECGPVVAPGAELPRPE